MKKNKAEQQLNKDMKALKAMDGYGAPEYNPHANMRHVALWNNNPIFSNSNQELFYITEKDNGLCLKQLRIE